MQGKKIYLEWLRILAIILVIYNHTRAWGYELHRVTDEVTSYWLSVIMIPVCRIAVPIFFMISGVTLLSKAESYKELFKKRILKYGFVILLFGTLQYLRFLRTGKVALSLTVWISAVYTTPILETYWFLYLYLGFLLLLPFMRKVAGAMGKRDFGYLFILNTVCCVLTVLGYFTGHFINGNVFHLSTLFFYPLMGYGVNKYGDKISSIFYLLLGSISLILVFALSVFYLKVHPEETGNFHSLLQVFTPLLCCGVFGSFKTLCKNSNNRISNIIIKIGSTVFGIYLIEDIVRNQFEKILLKTNINLYINDFLVAVLFTLFSFIASAIIIYLCKLLPLIKKLF